MAELEGHTDAVSAVQVTPDGKNAVTGSKDRSVRVWDLNTYECRAILEGHRLPVKALDLTPDARTVVTASDGYLPDFDEDDDDSVAYALSSGVRIWDLESFQKVAALEEDFGRGGAVAVASGRAVAFRGGTLFVWDLDTLEEAAKLRAPSDFQALDMTHDTPCVFSGHSDGTLRVWDLDGDPGIAPSGHTSRVVAVSVTPDGRGVSAGLDGTLKTWDLPTGSELATLRGPEGTVGDMAVTRDGLAVVATWGDSLTIWDLNAGNRLSRLEYSEDIPVLTGSVAVTPDGRYALVTYEYQRSTVRSGFLVVWDLRSEGQLRALRDHTAKVSAVAVTPDGRQALSGGEDRTLRLWDLRSGKMRGILKGHTDIIRAVAVAPNNKLAISASRDNTLKLWNLRQRSEVSTLRTTGSLAAVTVSPGGHLAASAGASLQVWHLSTQREQIRFVADAAFTSCAFSADGRTLLAGDEAGCVHLLRLEGSNPGGSAGTAGDPLVS
jgi:WD40 repeat protein